MRTHIPILTVVQMSESLAEKMVMFFYKISFLKPSWLGEGHLYSHCLFHVFFFLQLFNRGIISKLNTSCMPFPCLLF